MKIAKILLVVYVLCMIAGATFCFNLGLAHHIEDFKWRLPVLILFAILFGAGSVSFGILLGNFYTGLFDLIKDRL